MDRNSRQTEAVLRGFSGERTLALTAEVYRTGLAFSPFQALPGAPLGKGGSLPGTTVSEIHHYPLRPPGFEEPLFPTHESRRAIAEHLARAPWLSRVSELCRGNGQTARCREEPAHVLWRSDGRAYLVRCCGNRRRRTSKRRIVRVLERWLEVGPWWDVEGVDRLVFRVQLSGGAVVDLARERTSGEWLLLGVVD